MSLSSARMIALLAAVFVLAAATRVVMSAEDAAARVASPAPTVSRVEPAPLDSTASGAPGPTSPPSGDDPLLPERNAATTTSPPPPSDPATTAPPASEPPAPAPDSSSPSTEGGVTVAPPARTAPTTVLPSPTTSPILEEQVVSQVRSGNAGSESGPFTQHSFGFSTSGGPLSAVLTSACAASFTVSIAGVGTSEGVGLVEVAGSAPTGGFTVAVSATDPGISCPYSVTVIFEAYV